MWPDIRKQNTMLLNFIQRYKRALLYGVSLAALLFLLKWLETHLLIFHNALEMYTIVIALVFMAVGIWVSRKWATHPKQSAGSARLSENEAHKVPPVDWAACGLSKREFEVLACMAEGLSNQEIADRLFVSLNTVKTHAAKIFEKMEVKRRTQAVETARKNGWIS